MLNINFMSGKVISKIISTVSFGYWQLLFEATLNVSVLLIEQTCQHNLISYTIKLGNKEVTWKL